MHPFRVGTHPAATRPNPLFEVSSSSHRLDPSVADFSTKSYGKGVFPPRIAQCNRARITLCNPSATKQASRVIYLYQKIHSHRMDKPTSYSGSSTFVICNFLIIDDNRNDPRYPH